jgi:hypothetical protein
MCLWSAVHAASYQGQTQLTSKGPDDWQKYVRSPPDRIVRPVRVLANYTQGNVTDPDGLLTGRRATLLTRPAPAPNAPSPAPDIAPTIVVDFGQNIAGILSISFGGSYNATPGRPGIRLAFSETLEYLTGVSDFSRSYNVRSQPKHDKFGTDICRVTQLPQEVIRYEMKSRRKMNAHVTRLPWKLNHIPGLTCTVVSMMACKFVQMVFMGSDI